MTNPREIVVIGSLNLDLVATVPHFPQPGETLTGSAFERHTGGKGANQAVAASLAGASVCMIARHGTDGFETTLLATLTGSGVDISTILPAEGPSGVAVILVTESGQNSIVVIPGSNARLTPADILAQQPRIASAALILIQLETPLAVLAQTLALASAANVPVMLDPAPVQSLTFELLSQITWLTPNETEAAALLGEPVPDTLDLAPYAQRLLDLGPRNLLLKLGARGAFLATADGLRQHLPGHAVRAVDTTAAGDALNGAFAAALASGANPVEAARFGIAAAALSVTRPGAIPSLARRADIESFLAAL